LSTKKRQSASCNLYLAGEQEGEDNNGGYPSVPYINNFQKETNMSRKINLIAATFAVMTILFTCALANAQTAKPTPRTIIVMPDDYPSGRALSAPTPTPNPQDKNWNTTKDPSGVKDKRAVDVAVGNYKGWDGEVQGRVLVTPVTVRFDNPQDYDNFAAGKLRINLILKNMVSGQTIRLDSKQLRERFLPAPEKGNLTINVIVDNMSAPFSEAACGMISPSAENTSDGVDITLSYSACGTPSAQRTAGAPIVPIVKGGSNGGSQMTAGNPIGGLMVRGHGLSIMLEGSRVVTREAAAGLARAAGIIIISSSKGSGSNKAQNF
jgi:hypothetical protein